MRMKKKFRFYFPIIKREHLDWICTFLCFITALVFHFFGNDDKATFYMAMAIFFKVWR